MSVVRGIEKGHVVDGRPFRSGTVRLVHPNNIVKTTTFLLPYLYFSNDGLVCL